MNIAFQAFLTENHDTKKGLQILEAEYIEHILRVARYNQSQCARLLGLNRGTLRGKLKKYFGSKYCI